MGKIVGKHGLLFLVGITVISSLAGQITLRLLDTDRTPLKQAGAGRPFIIDVQVSDVSTIGQMPTVQGLDKHTVKNSGMRISSINGKTTANYSFELRIDKPGTYTIGPATLSDRGTQISSNSISVTIGTEPIEKETSSSKKNSAPILLRLTADKNRLVVGQRVRCSLKFYCTDSDISLRQLIPPELKDVRRSKVEAPVTGSEKLNGIEYSYVEWTWDCYPQVAGALVIPAYGVDYEQQIDRDDFWAGLGRMFGSHVQIKRVYSNALSLQVDPLPASKKTPNAIGHYTSFTISANPLVARQGEGIVVALELTGDGDPELVTFKGLEQIPAELKFYESKRTVTDAHDGKQQTIRFEYIVQGLKPGTWQIPAQSFYYFDTQKKSYQTLSTNPLSLGILQNSSRAPLDAPTKQDELLSLHLQGISPVKPTHHLPWWLFFVLCMIPFCILWYRFFSSSLRSKWQGSYGSNKAQRAFANGRKALAVCRQLNKCQDLYKIFIECFADRWQQPLGTITQSVINERLVSLGMSEKELVEWNRFFAAITQRAFSMQAAATDNHLLNQAELWIERLEKLL